MFLEEQLVELLSLAILFCVLTNAGNNCSVSCFRSNSQRLMLGFGAEIECCYDFRSVKGRQIAMPQSSSKRRLSIGSDVAGIDFPSHFLDQ